EAENGISCISDLECQSGYCAPSSGALAPLDAGSVATSPDGGATFGSSLDAGSEAGTIDAGVAPSAQPLAEYGSGEASESGTAVPADTETSGLCGDPGALSEPCDRDSGCESGRCAAGRCAESSEVPWCSGI